MGCLIGTAIDGVSDLGNTAYGVFIDQDASSNTIGGTTAGQGNTIAYNGDASFPYGIRAEGSNTDNNSWRRNLIHSNFGAAVDLAGDGANNDIAAPVVDCALTTSVTGTALASATVDLYVNTAGDQDSEVYLGAATADAGGTWTLDSAAFSQSLTVTTDYVVAIQTSGGNSSEMSAVSQVVASCAAATCDVLDFSTAPAVFESAATSRISATTLDSTHVLMAYRDEGNSNFGTAVVGTISGDSITYGTPVVFEAATTWVPSATTLDSTHVLIAYRDGGNGSYGTAVVGTISGNSITFGTPVVFNSAWTVYISATALDSTMH